MVGYNSEESCLLYQNDLIIASALSGFISRGVVQPLDVVKVRFQLQVEPLRASTLGGKYHGLAQAFQLILREEGGTAFWKGHVFAQCQAISSVTLQFYSYEMLTRAFGLYGSGIVNEPKWKGLSHFICGSLAGCVATVTTQPLDVLRVRFIAQGEPKVYKSFVHAVNTIAKKEGFVGFYRGLVPSLLLTAPQTGIQFTFYHLGVFVWNILFSSISAQTVSPGHSPSSSTQKTFSANVGVLQSFFAGGVAGACAKLTVYPLDFSKKRMQVQGFEEARARFGRLHYSHGLLNCLATTAREEGVTALYKGISPSLLKSVLSIGFRFCAYEQMCNVIRHYRTSSSTL